MIKNGPNKTKNGTGTVEVHSQFALGLVPVE